MKNRLKAVVTQGDVFLPVFLFALALYLPSASLYPTGYADSDEFLTMGYTLGVAHPSGFPLLVLLTGVVQRLLTVTNPAHAGNLLAALLQSASLGFIAQTSKLVLQPIFAKSKRFLNLTIIAGALITAVSRHFWQYGAVLEAPALTNALTTATLFCALSWRHASKFNPQTSLRWFTVSCLGAGLALSHIHTTILIYPSLAFILWQRRHQLLARAFNPLKHVSLGLLGWLTGFLVPNLLLFWFNQRPHQYSWYFKPTLLGWWRFIARQDYSGFFPEETLTRPAYIAKLGIHNLTAQPEIINYIVANYSAIGLLLIGIGVWFAFSKARRHLSPFILLLLFSGPIFIGYMGVPPYDPTNLEYYMEIGVTYRQFMIMHSATAYISIFGLTYLFTVLAKKINPTRLMISISLLSVLVTGYLFNQNFKVGYQRNNSLVQTYAHSLLDQVPEGGVIISASDIAVFSLMYAQTVEKYRPDVTMLTKNNLYVQQYLAKHPELYGFNYQDNPFYAANLMAWNLESRPVFFTNPSDYYIDYIGLHADPFYLIPKGYLFEVVKQRPPKLPENADYRLTEDILIQTTPKDPYAFGLRGYSASIHATVGQLYAYYGDKPLARHHFEKSLALFPTYDVPKQWLQKLPEFKSSPDYAPGYETSAKTLHQQFQQLLQDGQTDAAYIALRKATYLEPFNIPLRLDLIRLYIQGNYPKDVLTEITNIQAIDPGYQLPEDISALIPQKSPVFK